ncbi:protein SEMI-ROLLED LEAF 2-like isoform X2 [Phragmites australis]|uniref:protein SEMI-ROLLED LEAF 2-like isoform X2 n=1 Tax=Phragmites australis TaxID=29695 RepID=UPI002D79FE51|nr:protein SEMI-ROLLED LEAF 2-like isoform X2 [Phragmites australis]
MGVMSRRVLPACSSLCYFCPSLRARSRQPVKRYKKIIADIYQLPPNGEPNDRRVGKLCDYVSRNPARIPKITEYLEQRFYKELRHENFTLAKVVPFIYRKLLCSCKEHRPLLATSSLSIIRTLLDQKVHDDLRVMGCLMLVDFLNGQVDSTNMFNLEGLIPKLCQIGQELREDDKGLCLRSAALQALAFMVQYMGDHSHISMELDEVVSVVISCYEANQILSIKEVVRLQDDDDLVINGSLAMLPVSGQNSAKVASDTMAASENPAHWSRVCLRNMANIAKEATTVRRVLDPLFRLFDSHDYWSPENGIALSVLQEMQKLMDKSGQNGHLLLSFTIKHIDHKTVAKKPVKQISILKVASHLARHAKLKASVTIASAISDLIKHLRKCMHFAIEASNAHADVDKLNSALHVALEECLMQLTEKVGDVGPILDMVGVMLENLSHSATIARTTISSVYRTAQIAASVYKSSYNQKAFPEALFHQLLLAMMHPDNKTRIGSHRVLSTIVAPSLLCPWSAMSFPIPLKGNDSQGLLLLALSAFSSETVIDEMRTKNRIQESLQINEKLEALVGAENGYAHADPNTKQCPWSPCLNEYHLTAFKDQNLKFMKLNNNQIDLLLSSIWSQASLEDNLPANFEAMGHTYSIALLCSKSKSSSHVALVRCFQLAFSLRRKSLSQENYLQPSRKRCLYTLASAMLIFSAKVADLPQIIPLVKAAAPEKMVDPHFCLMDDCLHINTSAQSSNGEMFYGSEEDERDAHAFLSAINKDGMELVEIVMSHFTEKFENLPEKFNGIEEQLLQEFSLDDSFPLGAPLFMETPHSCSMYAEKDDHCFDEDVVPSELDDDDDIIFEHSGSQSDRKASGSMASSDVLTVNQLIESVHETARQVANAPVSANPVPYDQMKSQCEALVMEKQQKMSVLLSFKHSRSGSHGSTAVDGLETKESSLRSEPELQSTRKERMRRSDSASSESERSFRLPPASPYDKFLKAAGR